ncbi:MAG: tRNA dihydrouridine synthase [Candidatus Saccharimonadales bacterium]
MNRLSKIPKPFYILSPMYDVTDTVFRQIVADCSPPDLFFTEFINVDGLQSAGRPELIKKLKFSHKERPIIAQIWGLKPDNYYKTAKDLVLMGFDGIDINMGCPDKNVIKSGCCIALINNRNLAKEIIQATKGGAGNLPVSVKTRTGYNEVDLTWHEFLLNQDLAMLTIHGRTKKQMSKVPANWEVINEIRKLRDQLSPSTLIVGNGDVENRKSGEKLAKRYNLDGIMIGRGVFNDPYAFAKNSPWQSLTIKDRLDLFEKHIRLFNKEWADTKPLKILNKFCKVYINHFDSAKEYREKLMACNTADELLATLSSIRSDIAEW